MKSVLYLIKSELKLLKKSAILTSLILVIFIAAFFGITSASTDLFRNLCSYLNGTYLNSYQTTEISYESMYVSLSEASTFGKLSAYAGDSNLMYSTDSTYASADLYAENGNVFEAMQIIQIDEYDSFYIYIFSGYIVYLNDASSVLFDDYQYEFKGSWLNGDYQICLSAYVANCLEVEIGDTITVAEREFTLTGIYSTADDSDPSEIFDMAYYLSVGDDVELKYIDIQYPSSEEMFNCYRALLRAGIEVNCNFSWMYDDINEMQAVLAAVAALLVAVTIIAMYSLISLIFKQRKEHICRLKLLGASNAAVAGVYCGIISLIMLAVCLLGMAAGVGLNAYFMYICGYIFKYTFSPHFNFIIPIITFAALIIVCILLWFTATRKLKQGSIAEAVRHE